LHQVLARVQLLLQPSLKKGRVELAFEQNADSDQVAASEQSLQQIFVNLIQNSAQAMPDGGVVTVKTSSYGKSVVALVLDQGPGIAPKERSQVFDAFYTTKQAGHGTGLGLAVVKHLVTEF